MITIILCSAFAMYCGWQIRGWHERNRATDRAYSERLGLYFDI